MASAFQPHKQERDHRLLRALYLTPLTVDQALRWSSTWPHSFPSWKALYQRMEELRSAGWLRRWRYAIASRGASPSFYKLTLAGYRMLHDASNVQPPTKHVFARVSPALHRHTHSLAELIVKTYVSADQCGIRITQAFPENTVRIPGDGPTLSPDFVHQIETPSGDAFNFCWERDCGTETIRSATNIESVSWKLRRYEAMHYAARDNFRVVFFCDSLQRAQHILDEARSVLMEPRREVVYTCVAHHYFQAKNPFEQRLFQSNTTGTSASAIPRYLRKCVSRAGGDRENDRMC